MQASEVANSHQVVGTHLYLRSADGQTWDIPLRHSIAQTVGSDGKWEIIVLGGATYPFDPATNTTGLTLAACEAFLGAV